MVDLSRIKKHTGILNNTGVRCIVVFRKVPDDPTHCLLVETERLPDMYHDKIIEFVNSKEAQESNDFFEILNRRTFPDGLNALQALHYKGFLRKIPVGMVTLYPFPGQSLPLELLNAQLDGTVEEYNAKHKTEEEKKLEQVRKENPLSQDDPKGVAQSLLVQAELLEEEAKRKRDQAYQLAPEFMPEKGVVEEVDGQPKRKRGRPKLSAAEKAARAEARKVKRRAYDRAKAAEKRALKESQSLDDAVAEKILRDAERLDKED